MQLQLHHGNGAIELNDSVFGRDYNEGLVHQVVTSYLAKGRAGTKAQKTRGMVRGGGIKPWAQKHTGRARVGSIRSPLWRGGGKIFAAEPRSFDPKVNRKMYQGALRSILSELVRQDRLVVVDEFSLEAPKTKLLVARLAQWKLENVLIVLEGFDQNVMLASRNLAKVACVDVAAVDPVSLIGFDKVITTVAALRCLEGRLL